LYIQLLKPTANCAELRREHT